MDGYTRVLIWVFPVLGCDGILLLGHGLASIKVAFLEDHGSVAEYEVHGTVNVTFAEELTIGVHIACVLVPDDAAVVYYRVVSSDSEGHRLVLAGSGIVLESDVSCDETSTIGSCENEPFGIN